MRLRLGRSGRSAFVILSAASFAACSNEPLDSAGTTAAVESSAPVSRAHIMPLSAHGKGSAPRQAAPIQAQLTYRGGPVLQNVNVVTVFWGRNVPSTSRINAFYRDVTNSAYYDWLTEYNTDNPSQQIGRGTFGGTFTDGSAPRGTIKDASIQSRLARNIDQHRVPAPDANTLYAIHFSPGITINLDGSLSCGSFCAYHNSFSHNGVNVYYSVIPNQADPGCNQGCGSHPDPFDNTTSTSSHELVEATTDADVGADNDLAWYDDTNGEIGDICAAFDGSSAGYVVQLQWSNSQNACIDGNGTVAGNN
jgi:hypothetical protein